MIWLLFAGMTFVALGALLWPLWRARAAGDATGDLGVSIYRAQVAEIDRDLASGRIAGDDAKIARAEAARRLIAEGGMPPAALPSGPRRVVATAVVLVACLAGVLLYMRIGNPGLPDLPLQARVASPDKMDMAAALAKIEQHLAGQPDDLRGWTVIAPVYLRLGRNADAVQAYGHILRLGGDTAEHRADYAEAQVYAADGTVTPDARREFEAALQRDPKSAKTRYYLGLAAEQRGDKAQARAIWSALAADSPAGSPLAETLSRRVAEMDGTGNASAGDIAALPPDAQQVAIRGMVGRLADRLRENGDDIEGWLRLVRAWRVLNEPDKAKAALVDARRTFAQDDAAKARLDTLARELGLES